jgi:hypothetical protein
MSARIELLTTVKTRESRFGPGGIEIWRRQGLSVGKQPAWFRRIVDRDFGGSFNADWFDHFAKNGEQLVVEPYDLSHEDLRDLIAFADKYSLGVSISAVSHHFPTRTIAIFFSPREAA